MRGVLAINGGEVTEVAVQGSGSAFLRKGARECVTASEITILSLHWKICAKVEQIVQDLRETVQFLFLPWNTGPTLYSLYFVQRCIGRCRYLLKSKKGIWLTASCRQQIQHTVFFSFLLIQWNLKSTLWITQYSSKRPICHRHIIFYILTDLNMLCHILKWHFTSDITC